MALEPSPRPLASPLTLEDIKALTHQCSTRSLTGVRNRALIITLYRQGMRLSEALALAPRDIDRTRKLIFVSGSHIRAIPLDSATSEAVAHWTTVRAKKGLQSVPVLFCTLRGEPVEPAYVRQLLPRLARKAGIEKRVHAQALRDACAAGLARAGLSVDQIQERLGYESARSVT